MAQGLTAKRLLDAWRSQSMNKVHKMLSDQKHLEDLSDEEQDAVFAQLADWFDHPTDEVREAYAALGRVVGAVGSDENGNLVQRQPDGTLAPL